MHNAHDLPNVQIILAVDPTMQTTMRMGEFDDMDSQTITDPPLCFTVGIRHYGCKLLWAASTNKLALQFGK